MTNRIVFFDDDLALSIKYGLGKQLTCTTAFVPITVGFGARTEIRPNESWPESGLVHPNYRLKTPLYKGKYDRATTQWSVVLHKQLGKSLQSFVKRPTRSICSHDAQNKSRYGIVTEWSTLPTSPPASP
ncbi:hypothetical protein KC320_g260 [Hortaea werneckii]|nr:hypothetical protein KC320_g260 [Hortaea werneckii]